MSVDVHVRGQQGINFFTVGRIIMWIMDIYNLIMDYCILVRSLNDGFLFSICLQTRNYLLMLNDGQELCMLGLLMNYCDVFVSCLDSHSDGTHSL